MDAYCVLAVTIIVVSFITGMESTNLILENKCPYTIWPATLTESNAPALSTTGFTLLQGFSSSIPVPSSWQGRIWARTLCTTNPFICSTGDCGTSNISCNGNSTSSPVSLIEFTLNGFGNTDFYDVNLVDGFNVPVTITPSKGGCKSGAGCPKDINSVCPWQMAIKNPKDNTSVIACKSACSAFETEAYCCTGNFSTPQKCSQSDYAAVFKSQCPHAYTYAYDPDSNTFTCASGGDYFITFCPASAQPRLLGIICMP